MIEILEISLSGWGLILIGTGILTNLIAIAIEPSALQDWARDGFFGKNHTFKTWDEEEKALQKALSGAKEEPKTIPAQPPLPNPRVTYG